MRVGRIGVLLALATLFDMFGLTRRQALTFAHAQQRRISAALR